MSVVDDDARTDRPAELDGGISVAFAALSEILRGLMDVQLRMIVTTRLTPVIYVVLVCGVAGINLYFAIQAFDHSNVFGLTWLFLVMPVLFISGVVAVRVALEVILCIFRIVMNMEALAEQLHTLRGQTETIVEDLPRIQFWRARKRRAPNPGPAVKKTDRTSEENRGETRG